jgi:predicted RNA binding protein YcfA (HicA-like mRNA interferase family)
MISMPRKIRQLIADLESNEFENRSGKGSHRNFTHASGVRITIAGHLGDDARIYQERDLAVALQKAKEQG